VGWISALPWNQAPAELRSRATEELPTCSSAQPARCRRENSGPSTRVSVRGEILGFFCRRATAQSDHQPQPGVAVAPPSGHGTDKPKAQGKQEQIERKIRRWLSAPFVAELEEQDGGWRLQFDFDSAALPQLLNQRLGRTVLLTSRMDWSAEQIVAGDGGQQSIERVFRGLKDGEWLGRDPIYHWTDRKIRIHAFYCMLGISLLQYVHQQAKAALGGSVGRANARGTEADQTVRSALSASRRKGTAPHRLRAFAAHSGPTSLSQDSGACRHGIVVPHVGKTTQRS